MKKLLLAAAFAALRPPVFQSVLPLMAITMAMTIPIMAMAMAIPLMAWVTAMVVIGVMAIATAIIDPTAMAAAQGSIVPVGAAVRGSIVVPAGAADRGADRLRGAAPGSARCCLGLAVGVVFLLQPRDIGGCVVERGQHARNACVDAFVTPTDEEIVIAGARRKLGL
jgi:hypothetical protein